MTPAQFQKLFEKKLKAIEQFAKDPKGLPTSIGTVARDHFKANFILGGYVDDKLQPWKPAKRIGQSKSAAANYGTLLSSRKLLSDGISFTPYQSRVVVHTSRQAKYAKIHNEGGTITQKITPQMRKFAWAKYYESGETSSQWKGMALTKKTTRTIVIPQRKYMGRSIELNRKIQSRITKDLKRILTPS